MNINVNMNLAQIAREFIELYEEDELHHKDEMREWFAKHKLEYIAHGGSRVCVALDDKYVVKIALGEEYKYMNQAEYERYKDMTEEFRKNFTQIFRRGRDYSYLLVERVIPNIENNIQDVPDEISGLIVDNCYFNFGRRKNGEWVALDYADVWE